MPPLSRAATSLTVVFAVSALAVGAGWLTARDNLRNARAADYRTLLEVESDLVARWLDERRADARQLAADAEIAALGERLAAGGADRCREQTRDRSTLAAVLRQRFGEAAPQAAHILAADGTVLASLFGGYCGKRLTPQVVGRLADDGGRAAVFIAPIAESARIENAPAAERKPMVWFEAMLPAANGGAAGFVGYGLDAERHFDALFAEHSRRGQRKLFAVDAAAAPPDGATTPLLAAAAASLVGSAPGHGEVMEPYANARGRRVVGAWRVLPGADLAVALEVDAAATYRPLTIMRRTAATLLVLAALSGAAAILLRRRRFAADGTPRRVGPYRVLSLLGEGALANVYLADHLPMRRKVALKMLKTHAASDEWTHRFQREARLAGLLHHPNFVRLYDYGTAGDGGFYYAMEYLDGLTLAQLVERNGPVPPARTAAILGAVCEALAEAHALGLMHRDIKPQNVMLCHVAGQTEQTVKVLDFGLVKRMDGDVTRDLTAGLRILGTPAYMAPERIVAPASADPRSDLYAVAALGFFLLTGRKPFVADNDLHLAQQILHAPAQAPGEVHPGNSTPALDALILRNLAKDPAQRTASAAALAKEFAALEQERQGIS